MEMIIDHDYHVVELTYGIRLPPEMFEWLEERFGTGDRWFYMKNKIYFKNANDHLMFVIRWASE
jgi:hypothetical protein